MLACVSGGWLPALSPKAKSQPMRARSRMEHYSFKSSYCSTCVAGSKLCQQQDLLSQHLDLYLGLLSTSVSNVQQHGSAYDRKWKQKYSKVLSTDSCVRKSGL